MDWKNTHTSALIEQALREDRAANDITTQLTVDPRLTATATVLARQEMIVCGLGLIERVFEIYARLDRRAHVQRRFEVVSHPEIFDGVRAHDMQPLAVIRHNAQALLSCERVILNLMQHLSGIATSARQYVDAIEGTGTKLLDTRKTIPGLRRLEKYAVLCGGGVNHRMDLATGILIKNNHIALGGGVRKAVEAALMGRRGKQKVHVEVRTPEELEDALAVGAEALLLDNMTPAEVRAAVERVRKEPRPIPCEASGGIVLENIRAYAEAGADYVSVGALTHSVKAADISMRIAIETV